MGFFHFKNKCNESFRSVREKVVKVCPEEVDGVIINKVKVEEENSERIQAAIPKAQDYTLERLLAAGVPIEQVNISGMLNPSTITMNEIAEGIVTPILDAAPVINNNENKE